jgi:SAM-dependent methyltransferase
VSAHWYQTFFHGIALDLWRNAMTPETTRAEVDFIAAELTIPEGGHLLDVPCGNGRHAIEFAERGWRVTGVDLASESIAEARADAMRRGVTVEFIHADMRQLPAGPFDGAYCFGNSFGYLEEGGQEAFLAAVAGSLRPGARFGLDTGHAAESLLLNLKPEASYEFGAIAMEIRNDYDPLESVLHTGFTFTRDGVEDRRQAEARLYTVGEMGRMLRRAGFRRVAAYSSLAREPYRLGAQRLLLVSELSG